MRVAGLEEVHYRHITNLETLKESSLIPYASMPTLTWDWSGTRRVFLMAREPRSSMKPWSELSLMGKMMTGAWTVTSTLKYLSCACKEGG